ncbi:glycoside hydrolase family 68 protein [Halalkalicoccus sp. NIPERK01]|uniref:glycoside hydrolase family 68 protein n=1 Tax=Halalkalicoccus sp. NIPERK01 TaxID=3053469 RepID=UPI00256F3EF5|nr:glycoside hydrolase family 68 protein [Halalkalicoccus sp. NIPERK01]MDL5362454.1 glycoside hydrolase family 68 protein [Halalkalicoccus sp. NIPERK01]
MTPERRERTPRWTREHASRIERTDETVAPIIYPPREAVAPDVHGWDTWFLRERDGSIASIGGWRVIFSLTAPADLLPGKRHDVAEIRYFYSREGETWHDGGPVFEGETRGSRQWAGSALLDDGEVYVFYTASGRVGEADLTYEQRLAVGFGGTVEADDSGLDIEGPFEHEVLLEPDGERYEREEQYRGMIYTFRDPWFFEDPADGETYLLFEANTPVPEGEGVCEDPVWEEFNGSVGIARSPTGDPTDWELCDPLLEGICVNQELERPHVVVRDGRYYLFISSHDHTFAPGLEGPDGLYGFVADSLRGEYRPLNGSGLVLTNPANAPYQAYSWIAFPHREELLVSGFFNYYDLGGLTLDDVATLSPDEQLAKFGGTLAPTVRIAFDGDRTRITGTLSHGRIPLESEELPALPEERLSHREETRQGYGGY